MTSRISRRALLRSAPILGVGAYAAARVPRALAATATDDITFALNALTLQPAAAPTKSQNTDRAFRLLTDGAMDYGEGPSVDYDFTGVETSKRSVSVTASFAAVADIREVRLYAADLTDGYSITGASVSFTALDRTVHPGKATVHRDGSGTTTVVARGPNGVQTTEVTMTVGTAAKLALTELAVLGTAHGIIDLAVDDPAPYHAHPPGQRFSVTVTPQLIALGNLSHLATGLSLTPGAEPWGTQNVGAASELLTDGRSDYGSSVGVLFDFFGTDENERYVDIRLDYGQTAQFQSVTLTTAALNGEYSMTAAVVNFLDASGATVTSQAAHLSTAGNLTVASLALGAPVSAATVVVRASTSYKLNLTELQVTGALGTTHGLPDPRLVAWWKDFRGNRLSPDVPLSAGRPQEVQSPPAPAAGYLGLEFAADSAVVFSDHIPGEKKEFGFAVLPARTTAARKLDPRSFFGMVHDDIDDPYLVGWSKNTTWQSGTFDAPAWRATIQARTDVGLIELPLVNSAEWSDSATAGDTRPIGADQLQALRARLREHLQAAPGVQYWELGIEENLSDRFHSAPYYWSNLDAKVSAARQAAADAGTDTRFIFQIAEPEDRKGDITTFLRSPAARKFDVLSLHPYAWPDFPSPETWMSDMMTFTHEQMNAAALRMPIWFTEVGAPHELNYPGGWFGYGDRNSSDPEVNRQDTGLSRRAEVAYLIKVFALGLQMGADKVFWYNYIDHGADRTNPENAFGVIDFWGFPKPSYLGFVTAEKIDDRRPTGLRQLPGHVWCSTFTGGSDDVHVVWCYPKADTTVQWPTLGLSADRVTSVVNAVGTPQAVRTDGVRAGIDPVYVTATRPSG